MLDEPKNIKEEIKQAIELMAEYIFTDTAKKELEKDGQSSGYEEAIDFLIEKDYKFLSKTNLQQFVTMIHRLAVIQKYLDTIKKNDIKFNNKTILTGTQHIEAIEQIYNGLIHDCLFTIGKEFEGDDIDFNLLGDD